MEIFFRDALLLNGIQNLRDDEWFEQGDDIRTDEQYDKQDDLRTVAFGELPCFFPEVEDWIIRHRKKALMGIE